MPSVVAMLAGEAALLDEIQGEAVDLQ